MNLEIKLSNADLHAVFGKIGSDLQEAANAAVRAQTAETVGAMRVHISQRLSQRSANTITSKVYENEADGPKGAAGSVGGWIYSRWWRRPRNGEQVDLLAAFERGDVVQPVRGRGLAIALPQAYAVAGASRLGGRKRQNPTPATVEQALGVKLFLLRRPGKLALLCATGVATDSRGKRGKIRAASYVNKKGLTARRRTRDAVIPMFVLLKNMRLPKRLDFAPIVQEGENRLAEKLLIELARRDML